MKNNDYKKQAFLDHFIKNWCKSSDNHPEGWHWWKKFNRKQTRQSYKEQLRKEIDYQYNSNNVDN